MVDLDKLGKALVREIKKQILLMELVDIGDFLDSIDYKKRNNSLYLISEVDYAKELEYGTFALKSRTQTDFPSTAAQAKGMKKKDMTRKARKELPKGMIPFAPFRRVLYNKNLMTKLIRQSV